MELIELYDPSINKLLKVKVPSLIAEKCRKNAEFAQALFEEIQKENIQDGSVLDVDTTDMDDEESPNEVKNDVGASREDWSSEETLKLFEMIKKHRHLLSDSTSKDEIWQNVSSDLSSVGINRNTYECKREWDKACEIYNNMKNQHGTEYQYSQEVSAILDDGEAGSVESDEYTSKGTPNSCIERREIWSAYETLKFLKVYQTLKRNWKFQTHDQTFWFAVSEELAKAGINKNYKKCESKWKNVLMAYRNIQLKRPSSTKFPFLKQMEDLMNDVDLREPHRSIKSDDTEEDESQTERNTNQVSKRLKMDNIGEEEDDEMMENYSTAYWLDQEIYKLIDTYMKHKNKFQLHMSVKVWELISADLAKAGIKKDAVRCHNKWRNLKKAFMKNRRLQNSSSSSKRFYFSDEMEMALEEELALRKSAGHKNGATKTDDSDFDISEGGNTRDGPPSSTANEKRVGNGHVKDDDYLMWQDGGDRPEKTVSWSRAETIALIDSYSEHKTAAKSIDWEKIATLLSGKGVHKPSSECQEKWSTLYRDYISNKYKLGSGSFPFEAEIDAVFEPKAVPTKAKVSHCDKCGCCEKKMADKQRRHMERMNLLKTRLEVEQRKVLAFEKYLNSISS